MSGNIENVHTLEDLTALFQSLQGQMDTMKRKNQNKIQELEHDLNEVQLENKDLSRKNAELEAKVRMINSSSSSTTTKLSKEDERDLKNSIQKAKEDVPELTEKPAWPGNWMEFQKKFESVTDLCPGIQKFLKAIQPRGEDTETNKELPEKVDELKAMLPPCTTEITEMKFKTFYVWLKGKMASDISSVYKNIKKDHPESVKLLTLWINIINKFDTNNALVRDIKNTVHNNMTQTTEETFDQWVGRVKESANYVNELYEAADESWKKAGMKKIDNRDVFSRIRYGLNSYYMEIFKPTMAEIDSKHPNASLVSKLNLLRQHLTNHNVREAAKSKEESSIHMARTTESEPVTSSPYFKTTLHDSQASKLPCWHFDGTPVLVVGTVNFYTSLTRPKEKLLWPRTRCTRRQWQETKRDAIKKKKSAKSGTRKWKNDLRLALVDDQEGKVVRARMRVRMIVRAIVKRREGEEDIKLI